ncbi:MAG: PGPGW domain-containing protein [Candidatus Paceibacterota bacterium]|jgi:uncharacterized membrane protein YbaN (DUF454 family)
MKKTKKIIIFTVGIFFIILGLLGLVLPFLQGILFLIIGIFLLSFSFPKFRNWIQNKAEKSSSSLKIIKKIEKWIEIILGEV